ncbi:hypothetical protein [Streptomyces sp. NPDC051554]|uniref:hypothetical protein n=1 Tax=Streptomyces sp. NPDC051554 TaxID=3365656 RepID=UPI0037AED19C
MPENKSTRQERQEVLDILVQFRGDVAKLGGDTSEFDLLIPEVEEYVENDILPASIRKKKHHT